MSDNFQVLNFSNNVLALDLNGETIILSNAVSECINRLEYSPDNETFIIETSFQVNIKSLPEELQLRIEEIERQINAVK